MTKQKGLKNDNTSPSKYLSDLFRLLCYYKVKPRSLYPEIRRKIMTRNLFGIKKCELFRVG